MQSTGGTSLEVVPTIPRATNWSLVGTGIHAKNECFPDELDQMWRNRMGCGQYSSTTRFKWLVLVRPMLDLSEISRMCGVLAPVRKRPHW